MGISAVSFAIAGHSAWAPGLDTPAQWQDWSAAPYPLAGATEPGAKAIPPMLRRRAGQFGKMVLEVASTCLGERAGVPVVFCSRHGDVARAVELLTQLARNEALSPTGFGMAVHNASAGLLSIARTEQANHVALSAGASTLEHAVIEACALLADGAPQVLLVAGDCPLPEVFGAYQDCAEQPHAFAWLLAPAGSDGRNDAITLSWQAAGPNHTDHMTLPGTLPGSLDVLRFYAAGERQLVRTAGRTTWCWSRHA